MKINYLILLLLLLILQSCENSSSTFQDYGYDEYVKDLKKCGKSMPLGRIGEIAQIFVLAKSEDNKTMICNKVSSTFILRIKGEQVTYDGIDFPNSINNDSVFTGSVRHPLFCPYDQNIFLFLTGVILKQIDQFGYESWVSSPQWCLYNLETKSLTKLTFSNPEVLKFVDDNSFNRSIIHWSSNSSKGNDIFYLSNFQQYHIQSGIIEKSKFINPNISNGSTKLAAVSPDESKYFSFNSNNEIFLNTKRIPEVHIIKNLTLFGIHWSKDSKYVSAEENIYENVYIPSVYRIDDNYTLTRTMGYNMLKKHCSLERPGCPVFISDTSFIYGMYPNASIYGDLYEFNKYGDVIKKITNFVD